jgi:hypothetical protein
MSAILKWMELGSRIAQIIILEKDDSSGKYKLPTTLKKYLFVHFGDGSGIEQDKPAESSSSDTYMSFEGVDQTTTRYKLNPETYTYKSGDFVKETGTGTSKTYPSLIMVCGNTPKVKTGTTVGDNMKITDFIELQIAMQSSVALISLDAGREIGSSDAAGTIHMLGMLTSKIESKPNGKEFKGYSLTFTGESVALDSSIDATSLTGLFESMIPMGRTEPVQLAALTVTDLPKLAGGDLVFK